MSLYGAGQYLPRKAASAGRFTCTKRSVAGSPAQSLGTQEMARSLSWSPRPASSPKKQTPRRGSDLRSAEVKRKEGKAIDSPAEHAKAAQAQTCAQP